MFCETNDYIGWRWTYCDFRHTWGWQFPALEPSIRPLIPRPYLRWFPVPPAYCLRLAPGL